MMMKKGVAALCLVMLVVLVAEVQGAPPPPPPAVGCNPSALLSCLGPITFGTSPSQACCNALKAQQPCFCQYIANPTYQPYIDSPNAKTTAAKCGVATPTC